MHKYFHWWGSFLYDLALRHSSIGILLAKRTDIAYWLKLIERYLVSTINRSWKETSMHAAAFYSLEHNVISKKFYEKLAQRLSILGSEHGSWNVQFLLDVYAVDVRVWRKFALVKGVQAR